MVIRPSRRLRRPLVAALAVALAGTAAACEPHTVDLGFDPAVGATYRFRSTIDTEVERIVDGTAEAPIAERSVLEAVETVTDVDDDGVTLSVEVTRDGTPSRDYVARFERGEHLSAAGLVEGAAADAVGLDLAAELPGDLSSPPSGPLEPGQRWRIWREVQTDDGTIVVSGHGRVRTLGVSDGRRVAFVEVDLVVPIRSSIDNPNGTVHLEGTQTSRSRSTYDLAEGTVRSDRTTVEGDVSWTVEPPEGVDADPVPGSIDYSVTTDTRRVTDG